MTAPNGDYQILQGSKVMADVKFIFKHDNNVTGRPEKDYKLNQWSTHSSCTIDVSICKESQNFFFLQICSIICVGILIVSLTFGCFIVVV